MDAPNCRKVDFSDCQLLRYWRNQPQIRKWMMNKELISFQSQLQWFNNLNDDSSMFFIYSIGNIDVGSFYLSRINNIDKSFEPGIYCGNDSYHSHWINIWALLELYHIGFDVLGLNQAITYVDNANMVAIKLNKSIGFQKAEFSNDKGFSRYFLTRENFMVQSSNFRRIVENFSKSKA